MNRRQFVGAGGASTALLLGGCDDERGTVRFRHRLMLEVEVDGRMVSGSTVVEFLSRQPNPKMGIAVSRRGEALALELRPGQVLVALLEPINISDVNIVGGWRKSSHWSDLSKYYGVKRAPREAYADEMKRLVVMRGPRDLNLDDLEALVTFDDITDPKSVKLVNPRDLAASFGPGVRITRGIVEIVEPDTPLTANLNSIISWVDHLMTPQGYKTIANIGTNNIATRNLLLIERISGSSFKQGK
jgi:hypothetical protein